MKSTRREIGNTEYWVIPNTCGLYQKYNPFTPDLPPQIYQLPDSKQYVCICGILHREDGPAAIVGKHSSSWYRYGQLHCTDGPAVVCDHYEAWCLNGKLHRLDGPAIVDTYSYSCFKQLREEYYINGVNYCNGGEYQKAIDRWLTYKDVTREEIKQQIGQFRIVEWE